MSRYFFHVAGRDSKFKDENGQHFGTLQDVAAHAFRRSLCYDEARFCARSHTPNATTTAPAKPNQVMAYCM